MTFNPLEFTPCRRGDTGEHVARLQGWLALHGYDPGPVDGEFGDRTHAALMDFQRVGLLDGSPNLTPSSWQRLTAPLARAMAPLEKWRPPSGALGQTVENMPRPPTIGEAVAACARQWLAQSVGGGPLRELQGNSGPVVEACTRWLAERDRLPCVCFGHPAHTGRCGASIPSGRDDDTITCMCDSYCPDWRLAWCAAVATKWLEQGCASLGVPMPIAGSLSCDELARQAQERQLFWRGDGTAVGGSVVYPRDVVKPGDLFLVRAPPGSGTRYHHCGAVLGFQPKTWHYDAPTRTFIRTAEGNTNKDGGREGTGLLERTRGLDGLDFICWRES